MIRVKPLMYLKLCFLPKSSEQIFYIQKAKAVFFSFCLVNNLCFQTAFEFRRKLKGVASLASPATCFSDTCMVRVMALELCKNV